MHFSKLKQYLQTQTSERAKLCDVGQVLAQRGDRGHGRMVHLRLLEFLTPSDMLEYLELGTSNSYSTVVCLFLFHCRATFLCRRRQAQIPVYCHPCDIF